MAMSAINSERTPGRTVVVACRVMEPELERVRKGLDHVEIRYLKQVLHRTPKEMAGLIQEQVDEAAGYAERIVLGYGLCSNGIVGVKARDQGLIVPKCHDCIGFFLGSPAVHKRAFEERPGTYYLTPGWVAEKKDPLGIVEEDYMTRYDRQTAMWVMAEELKHYTHITLIDVEVKDIGPLRDRAMENARVLKKKYEEIKGSLGYFSKIVRGAYDSELFFKLKPDERVSQEMFIM